MTAHRAHPEPTPAGGGSDPALRPALVAVGAFPGGFGIEVYRIGADGSVRLDTVGPTGTLLLPVEALLPVADMLRSATRTRETVFVYGRVK